MQSGLNTASRIGIKGIEEITDDLSVGFRLETALHLIPGH